MYLAQLRGEPAGADREDVDLDAAWASIVAGYDAEVDAAAPPWPAAENVADRRHDDTDPDLRLDGLEWEDRDDRDRERPRRDSDARGPDDVSEPPLAATVHPARGDVDEPSLLDALDTFGANLPADDEGRFTPPPAPPVPRPPVPVVLALVGIAVGLLLFFQPNLAPIDEDLALLLGFGLLLAGVVALVWRLRPGGEEDDDDPDDGAVV